MTVESRPVTGSKSNGIVQRAIESLQGIIRTQFTRGKIVRCKLESCTPVWPWIARHTGILLSSFEVGHDGTTAYERLEDTPAKVQELVVAECILWQRRHPGGPLVKSPCMLEDGVD